MRLSVAEVKELPLVIPGPKDEVSGLSILGIEPFDHPFSDFRSELLGVCEEAGSLRYLALVD